MEDYWIIGVKASIIGLFRFTPFYISNADIENHKILLSNEYVDNVF